MALQNIHECLPLDLLLHLNKTCQHFYKPLLLTPAILCVCILPC